MLIQVKVNTSAKKVSVEKIGEMYVVKFKSAREKGQANQRLIEILAEYFHVSKSRVEIVQGHTSTMKRVKVEQRRVG